MGGDAHRRRGNCVTEAIAQVFRQLRHGVGRYLPPGLQRGVRELALRLLDVLSFGKGRAVLVAGQFPMHVEWSRAAINFEAWERAFTEPFGKCLNSHKIVFDVGASIGEWSALAATLVGEESVHVFEPNKPSWRHIRRIFQLNKLQAPAGIFQGFVSNIDRCDEEELSRCLLRRWPRATEGDLGFETLLSAGTIPTISLDTYCQRLGVEPDVIKIDVEGAEGLVLKGARELIEHGRPTVFLSVHPWALPDFGHSVGDIRAMLIAARYTVRILGVDHEEHWLASSD